MKKFFRTIVGKKNLKNKPWLNAKISPFIYLASRLGPSALVVDLKKIVSWQLKQWCRTMRSIVWNYFIFTHTVQTKPNLRNNVVFGFLPNNKWLMCITIWLHAAQDFLPASSHFKEFLEIEITFQFWLDFILWNLVSKNLNSFLNYS